MTLKSAFTLEDLAAQDEAPAKKMASSTPTITSTGTNTSPVPTTANLPPQIASNSSASGAVDLTVRREIAEKLELEMHGTTIEWQNNIKGVCTCPNRAQHTGSSREECVLWIDGNFGKDSQSWPNKHCSHAHCIDHPLIRNFNRELHSRIGRAEKRQDTSTPNGYLKSLYPELAERHGDPLRESWVKESKDAAAVCKVHGLNHRFFTALLLREANADDPCVFDVEENKPFRYCQQGFYQHIREEQLYEKLSALLLEVARKCSKPNVDTGALEYTLRHPKELAAVVTMARGAASLPSSIWRWPLGLIPVMNGIVLAPDRELFLHSPDFYFRGVVAVCFDEAAKCPEWLSALGKRVARDDVELLQRIFGLALHGANVAQIMTLLIGVPNSMKGTIVQVLVGLLGPENCGSLRTDCLLNPFELGRHRHKLLIYGADVPENFLNVQGAHVLKAITGADPISPEFKHSNAVPPAEPIRASVLVSANSRLRIRFEGDKAAWARRLRVIEFSEPVPEADRKPEYAAVLLSREGSGILNWGLEGLRILREENFNIKLNERQTKVRDRLLDESESSVAFAIEMVIRSSGCLTAKKAYDAYVTYCEERGWAPETPWRFGSEFKQTMRDRFGVTQCNSIVTPTGDAKGWRGISLKPSRIEV